MPDAFFILPQRGTEGTHREQKVKRRWEDRFGKKYF
jgi:hypothetical protein